MNILVPVDGSKYSEEAIKIAIDYAKTKGASICLMNVAPHVESMGLEISASEREKLNETFTKRAAQIVRQACDILAKEDIIATCRHVVSAHSVPDAILDYAEDEKIDLIIIGSQSLGKSSRFKMGSVAAKVVKHSPCSVYVVKLSE